jgi:hypothetical protein
MDDAGTPPKPGQPLPEPPRPGIGPQPGLGPHPPGGPVRPVGNPNAGWFVMAGGILVLVGVFLPWVTVGGAGVTRSISGKDASEWGILILGGFATVRGLSMTRPDRFRFTLGTPLIGGVILAVLVAMRWSDLQDAIQTATAAGLSANLGIGIWAVVAGTACVLIGGVLGMRRRL